MWSSKNCVVVWFEATNRRVQSSWGRWVVSMGRDTKQLLDAAVINLLCNQYKSVRDLHVKVSDSVLVFDPLNT